MQKSEELSQSEDLLGEKDSFTRPEKLKGAGYEMYSNDVKILRIKPS